MRPPIRKIDLHSPATLYGAAPSILGTKYFLPLCTVLPDPPNHQPTVRVPFFGIPAYHVLDQWPDSQFPSRQQIFARIGDFCYLNLLQSLSNHEAARIRSLAKFSIPEHDSNSSVVSSHTTSLSGRTLSHSPMSLMGLTCSLKLSNRAVLVTTAMQCGMPIPPSCVRFPLSAASVAHDPFGHFTLNSNRNTARYSSHELIVRELTAEFEFCRSSGLM